VLEPVQAAPVVIEDGAFIGSRCIGRGMSTSARVWCRRRRRPDGNTPLIDPRGAEPLGIAARPAGAIVVPRAPAVPGRHLRMPCGLIIGERTAATNDKVALNDMLRDRILLELAAMPQHPQDRIVESPIAATWRSVQHERAVLVGIGPGIMEADLDELAALADSAGAEPVGRIIQSRAEPDPQLWIGKGKVEELHQVLHATHAELVLCDQELSPGHLRSLEAPGRQGGSATALILTSSRLHAHTREGKAQVELAQLNYLLPRLRGWGGDEPARRRYRHPRSWRGPRWSPTVSIRRRISKLRRDVKAMQTTRDRT
jgi:hypothetical protein